MSGLILALVLAGSGAAPTPPEPRPVVALCERDGMAERQLRREHGRADWTTSAEVLAAVRAGRGWAQPRCISRLELWRAETALERERKTARAQAQARRVLASR
jgi:hypothetical protein